MNYFKQIIFIVILLMLLVLVIRLQLVINEQDEKMEDLTAQLEEQEKQIESMEYELSKPLDEEAKREIAEEHGYVNPGEELVYPIEG